MLSQEALEELAPLSAEQQSIADWVVAGHSVFFTGCAGEVTYPLHASWGIHLFLPRRASTLAEPTITVVHQQVVASGTALPAQWCSSKVWQIDRSLPHTGVLRVQGPESLCC